MSFNYSYTQSLGEKPFTINIQKIDGQSARAWIQILDRNDGSYIVRYKLFEPVQDLTIEIWHGATSKRVAKSPYKLSGEYFFFTLKLKCMKSTILV